MASTGGLTRRRGGGTGTGEEGTSARTASPAPKATDRTPETSYTGGENGHKIAFDPRDISESEERNKQPKLTLMEEILLMGLKDKQVSDSHVSICSRSMKVLMRAGVSFILERQYLIRSSRLYSH